MLQVPKRWMLLPFISHLLYIDRQEIDPSNGELSGIHDKSGCEGKSPEVVCTAEC